MNNKLYDALEICLQEIENGATLENVVARFPDLAAELRPILSLIHISEPTRPY